jgi:hypothetical protein
LDFGRLPKYCYAYLRGRHVQPEEYELAAIIEKALLECEYDPATARDVAFHMTDWLSELRDYAAFTSDPDALDSQAVADLLIQFLVHVPAHLNAAHRLLMDDPVTDPFGIGAVSEGSAPEA